MLHGCYILMKWLKNNLSNTTQLLTKQIIEYGGTQYSVMSTPSYSIHHADTDVYNIGLSYTRPQTTTTSIVQLNIPSSDEKKAHKQLENSSNETPTPQ